MASKQANISPISDDDPGTVYVMSNEAAGNAVLAFPRGADGRLGEPVSFPTRGTGTGAGLGNQGAIALGQDLLYVVNPGSDDLTGFRVTAAGLVGIGTWGSGGDLPISLARTGSLLYVLNDGAETTLRGFAIGNDGSLTPVAAAARNLGTGVDAAEVAASPDGTTLVVTLKAANQIVGFPILPGGGLGNPVTTASSGATPFGFGFDNRGSLIVSEAAGGAAGASSASSYRASGGGFSVVTASLATNQSAICWIAVSPNGRLAFAANTGSATVTGFAIGQDGSLSLLDAGGVSGTTGTTPVDLGFSRNGRFLYVLNAGSNTISGFRVAGGDGSLTALGQMGTLPRAANGLASW
ncbi:MAG TPA: beta-propeller fold lactonase family protein [Gemmatimonadales bacterium]